MSVDFGRHIFIAPVNRAYILNPRVRVDGERVCAFFRERLCFGRRLAGEKKARRFPGNRGSRKILPILSPLRFYAEHTRTILA